MIRLRRVAVWVGAIFLAVTFVSVGVSKLEGASARRWAERFGHWGYPANTQYVVGVFEILGGVGVLIPAWRRAAALTLGALMMGALCTHVVHAEFGRAISPLVLGGLAFLMYRSHARSPVVSGEAVGPVS
jgi:uncharacterized membrane protein YphA (DoxX/SURF4 family)